LVSIEVHATRAVFDQHFGNDQRNDKLQEKRSTLIF